MTRVTEIAETLTENGFDVEMILDGIDALAALVAGFGRLPAFAALTVCEINPSHARDLPAQLGRVVDLVATAVTPG